MSPVGLISDWFLQPLHRRKDAQVSVQKTSRRWVVIQDLKLPGGLASAMDYCVLGREKKIASSAEAATIVAGTQPKHRN